MSSSTMNRRKGGVARRAGLTVALALGALAAVPAVASASTVSISGSTITFAAASGEINGVTVTVVSTNYRFADGPGPDPTAGSGCTDTGATVDCPLNPSTAVTANLGDEDDTFTATGVNQDPFTINGGSQADTLTGSDANDFLNGGPDDVDVLHGGPGNDRMDGGTGSDDSFDGGTGRDRVVYGTGYTCTNGVNVTIDNNTGTTDEGCAGDSGENVQTTVESLTGTSFADVVTGSCFDNTFSGLGGNDTLNGDPAGCLSSTSDGNEGDFLGGGTGNDTLDGDGSGNQGIDTVTYTFASGNVCTSPPTGVNVTLDDVANDTDCVGGTDNVKKDIDKVYGSAENDTINACGTTPATRTNCLTGTGAFGLTHGVSLFGRAGGDTLYGTDNSDFLAGEAGTDTLDCKGGSDTTGDTTGDTVTNCSP